MSKKTQTTRNRDLDKLNNDRVEEAKLNVAKAIKLLNIEVLEMRVKEEEAAVVADVVKDLSTAVNLVEVAAEVLRFACEHFGWDTGVIDQLEDAVGDIGGGIAQIVDRGGEDDDPIDFAISCYAAPGRNKLAFAIATLCRWFEEPEDERNENA